MRCSEPAGWTGRAILSARALEQRGLRQLSSGPARFVKSSISSRADRASAGAPRLVPLQA